ncbi:PorV/PorQ family protein [Candidatus Poribacteria bacterium]|nr:PorV/PorQ family protein [Candidatus Poribacteria bacterium]
MLKTERRYVKDFIVAVCILFAISFACAISIADEIGTEDAAFLKIDAASRPAAMGGAFVGVANDVNSVFWNPAGLTQTEKRELSAMYNSWFAGINYGSGAYSQRIGNAAVGLSVIYLQSEIQRRTDDTEEADSTFNAYSMAAGISGSYALIPKVFSLGGTVKLIDQDFDVEDSNGTALDLGGMFHISKLNIGGSVQNIKLHSSLDDGSLPLGIRAGISYPFVSEGIIAAEFSKQGAADATYHIGVEKWFKKILAMRLGYCLGSGDNPKEGFSLGLGLKAYGTKPMENMNFQFDYAYVPEWDGLGDTHRISMMVRF